VNKEEVESQQTQSKSSRSSSTSSSSSSSSSSESSSSSYGTSWFAKTFYDGGFEEKMNKREAALILGVQKKIILHLPYTIYF
jgi:hypothetical protein